MNMPVSRRNRLILKKIDLEKDRQVQNEQAMASARGRR
jgi:hypothetical protein